MTVRKLKSSLGFTLVELLIVIALLGVIALIVIAAINPIEQANRARDTRFKADGAQYISAVDRYFAVMSQFPWVTSSLVVVYDNEDSFGFVTAAEPNAGLCEDAACSSTTTHGTLITNDELKLEFKNRDFVQDGGAGATMDEILIVGKATGASASVYACFVPLSNAIKQTAVLEGKVYKPSTTDGTKPTTTTCDGVNGDGKGVDWVGSNIAASCWVCIP